AAGPQSVIAAMSKIQGQNTSNATTVAQVAATAALNGDQGVIAPMLKAFKERHDYVVGRLNGMKGISCLQAQGTFYAFPNVEQALRNLGLENVLALADYL